MFGGYRALIPDLGRITVPLLYFRSTVDHVVDESSEPIIVDGVSSADVEVVRDMYDNVMAGDVLEMAVNRHGETVILNPVVD